MVFDFVQFAFSYFVSRYPRKEHLLTILHLVPEPRRPVCPKDPARYNELLSYPVSWRIDLLLQFLEAASFSLCFQNPLYLKKAFLQHIRSGCPVMIQAGFEVD